MNFASIPGTVILNRDDPDGFSKMPRWEQQQYKSFRAWLMYNVGQPITSLTRAIHDGTLLAKLVANLTGDKITGLEPRPRLRIQCINNVGLCFNYFTKAGLNITNISPEDIVDGNVKLTLGFIWLLILHWGINTPKPAEPTPKESTTTTTSAKPAPAPSQPQHVQQGDPKLLLMDKVNGMYKLTELPFVTSNFTSDWQDGMRFGALLHANDSSLPPNWNAFSPDNARQNLEVCFNVFRKELRLPEILSVEDLLDEKPDEKAVMTFVAMIISALNKREQEAAEAAKEEEAQPEPVVASTPAPVTTTPSPSTSSPTQTRNAAPPSQVAALFGARRVEKLGIEQEEVKAQPVAPAVVPKKRKPRKKKPEFKGPQVNLRVCQARRLKPINGDPDDESEYPEAYVKLDIKDRKSPVKRATTSAEPSLYPEWHEEFEYAKGELKDEDVLEFNVLDKLSDTDFGIVRLPVKDIADATEREKAFDYWLPLYDRKTGERVGEGEFRIVATTGNAPLPVQTQYMPIKIRVAAGRELKGVHDGLSDPYVELDVPGMRMKKNRTKTCERTVDPEWDEEFFFDSGTVDAEKDVLTLKVFSDTKDKTKVPLGVVQFPFKQCLENPFTDDWFPVKNPDKPDEEGQGDIELVVTYGKDLPPVLTKTFLIGVLAARNLVGATSGKSDPYIQIWVPGRKSKKLVLKTKTKKKTSNPVWNQEFEFELDNFEVSSDVMEFHIFDRDLIGENAPLGIVELALKDIIKVAYIDRWFTIYDHKHRSKKGKGELHMRIAFGKKEKQILLDAFESDRPSKIGPPQTVFYRSKTLTEKWKKEKIEQRYNAAKGLPIRVRIVTATGLPGNPSSFVTTTIPGKKTSHKLKTKTKSGSNAVWNEEFNMSLEPLAEEDSIRFTIKNGGMTGPMLSHVLGQADVAVKDVMKATDGVFTSALTLHNAKGKLDKNRGSLHVLIAFGEGKLPEVIVEGKEK